MKSFSYKPDPEVGYAVIMLHPGCNMTCNFCVTDNSFTAMSWGQAMGLLDVLEGTAVEGIILGGGEPLTWGSSPYSLAKEAKARGFHVQIGTNGIDLPEDFARSAVVDRYILALDGADRMVHDALRIYRYGHHGLTMKRLEALREAGKSVTVSTVVTAQNQGDIPALGAFLRDYSASGGQLHAWHLYKFVPEGRGGRQYAAELNIDTAAFDAVCDAMRQEPADFHIYKRKDMFNSKSVDFFWAEGDVIRACSQVRETGVTELPHTCESYTFLPQPA